MILSHQMSAQELIEIDSNIEVAPPLSEGGILELVADNDTDSETSECESDNEKEHVSLHKAREGLMTAIDFFEQHPSLSPSHLEQLLSTLCALDTTSTISGKQTGVTDYFQR